MPKVYDFLCENCSFKKDDVIIWHNETLICPFCGCGMIRLFPCPRSEYSDQFHFKPFYSDTFDMPVRDREDLNRLRALRKEHGLECVGHRNTQPDHQAIRNNYENENLTVSKVKEEG